MRQRSGLIYFRQKGETSVSGACDRTVRSETQCSDGIAIADRERRDTRVSRRNRVTISFSGDINGVESDGVGRAEKREWHLCQAPVFGSLQAELEALVLVTGP